MFDCDWFFEDVVAKLLSLFLVSAASAYGICFCVSAECQTKLILSESCNFTAVVFRFPDAYIATVLGRNPAAVESIVSFITVLH